MPKKKSIFRRIILNVILPEIFIFIFIAVFTYQEINKVYENSQNMEIESSFDEIEGLSNFKNQSLDVLHDLTSIRAEKILSNISFQYSDQKFKLVDINLDSIAKRNGLNPELEDLYIVNIESGIVVNTTYKKDLNLDLFSFGDKYMNFLKSIIDSSFYAEEFTIESNTKKYKLYAYMPSWDKKYVFQIAMYSKAANEFKSRIKERLDGIAESNDIDSIEVYLVHNNGFISEYGEDRHYGYWDSETEKQIEPAESALEELALMEAVVEKKSDSIIKNENRLFAYKYIKLDGDNACLIKIEYDESNKNQALENELIRSTLLFLSGIAFLIIMLVFNIKRITKPIRDLHQATKAMSDGNLEVSIEVKVEDEVGLLAKSFNEMAESLKKSTEALILERKIVQEKNREITDSINYAKRIQSAILPPQSLIKESIPNSFVLYLPKDIVAGDFYWMEAISAELRVPSRGH